MINKTLIILFGHVNGPNEKRELVNGQLSEVAISRCDLAVNQLKDDPDAVVLPTGAFGKHFNETDSPHWKYLRKYLVMKGVSEGRILSGTESSNTFQDCLCARRIILDNDYTKIVAITSEFHVARVSYILDRIFSGIQYSAIGAETPSKILVIEELEEKKSFDWLKTNWITPPLYEKDACLPGTIYEATASDQKHYDTVSLATVTGALVLSGLLIQFVTNAKEFFPKTGALWAGALVVILFLFIYERTAAAARTARRTLQAIEIGFGQRGFSANYIPEQLFTRLPSIQSTVRYIFFFLTTMLIVLGLLSLVGAMTEKASIVESLQPTAQPLCGFASTELGCSPCLRQSHSMAASSGVSIAIIKEVLGHTDVRTTQKYSHVDVLSQSQVFATQRQPQMHKLKSSSVMVKNK